MRLNTLHFVNAEIIFYSNINFLPILPPLGLCHPGQLHQIPPLSPVMLPAVLT